jgi:hypothetical protein
MTLPRPGGYEASIILDRPAGRVGSASFTMVAREQSPTPPMGAPAPSVRTPIAADVGGNLQLISSDVFPDPRFYEHSVDELLAAHRPFVFTIYSPAFCPTTACGPLLRYLKRSPPSSAMTFVHAEPYVMRTWAAASSRSTRATASRGRRGARPGIPVEPTSSSWGPTGGSWRASS